MSNRSPADEPSTPEEQARARAVIAEMFPKTPFMELPGIGFDRCEHDDDVVRLALDEGGTNDGREFTRIRQTHRIG